MESGMGSSRRSLQTGTVNRESTNLKSVCLIISPCGEPDSEIRTFADELYNKLILPAFKGLHLVPERLDQMSPQGDINSNLVSLLWSASLCISVLDRHNPNVMIETGIRLAYDKPIVFLKSRETELPFDIISRNSIEYNLSTNHHKTQSIAKLANHLKNPTFHRDSAFSSNLAEIGAAYELLPTCRAKLRRLDKFLEDVRDLYRDIELDEELDSQTLKKRISTRKSHEGKLVAIAGRLRHEINLLTTIVNESRSNFRSEACKIFIYDLCDIQRDFEKIRKQLFTKKVSTKASLLRSADGLLSKAVTIRDRNSQDDA